MMTVLDVLNTSLRTAHAVRITASIGPSVVLTVPPQPIMPFLTCLCRRNGKRIVEDLAAAVNTSQPAAWSRIEVLNEASPVATIIYAGCLNS